MISDEVEDGLRELVRERVWGVAGNPASARSAGDPTLPVVLMQRFLAEAGILDASSASAEGVA